MAKIEVYLTNKIYRLEKRKAQISHEIQSLNEIRNKLGLAAKKPKLVQYTIFDIINKDGQTA